jgi:hypothetical protein
MSFDQASQTKNWKVLWVIQALGKMKIVLWRMAPNYLPTGVQLKYRHIPAGDRYVFCGQSKNVEHLFLLCPFARMIWSSVKDSFPLKLRRGELTNAKQ